MCFLGHAFFTCQAEGCDVVIEANCMFELCKPESGIICNPIEPVLWEIELRDWCDTHRPIVKGGITSTGDGTERGEDRLCLCYVCPAPRCLKTSFIYYRCIHHRNSRSTDLHVLGDQIKVLKAKLCNIHRSPENSEGAVHGERTENGEGTGQGRGYPQIIGICPALKGCRDSNIPPWALLNKNWTTYILPSGEARIFKGKLCDLHRPR